MGEGEPAANPMHFAFTPPSLKCKNSQSFDRNLTAEVQNVEVSNEHCSPK